MYAITIGVRRAERRNLKRFGARKRWITRQSLLLDGNVKCEIYFPFVDKQPYLLLFGYPCWRKFILDCATVKYLVHKLIGKLCINIYIHRVYGVIRFEAGKTVIAFVAQFPSFVQLLFPFCRSLSPRYARANYASSLFQRIHCERVKL